MTLALEILAQGLLNLREEIGQSIEALLNARYVRYVHYEGRFRHLLHEREELGIDVVEPLRLERKKVLDVGASSEDPPARGRARGMNNDEVKGEEVHA